MNLFAFAVQTARAEFQHAMTTTSDSGMKRWMVVGPEYGVVDPILDDGTGPMEYGCDVVEVEAASKADALVLGVRELRKIRRGYLWRYPDECPFTGVKVFESEQA